MRVLSPLLLAATLSACVGQMSTPADPPTTSYTRDIQPLVERSCSSCHAEGGIGPFVLATYDDARTNGPAMYDAIASARMPPFFASADCNAYEGDFRFSADEKALFRKWLDEGAPRGTDQEAVHAQVTPPATIRHDKVLGFEGDYDFRTDAGTDNYRCFLLDPGYTEDVQITGYELIPDNIAVLHHMLAYAVAPEELANAQALVDEDPEQGYSCLSGSVRIPNTIQSEVAGWVPGGAATRLPDGTGLVLKAGSKIIMQVHYNTAALYRQGVPTVDHTHLALEVSPAVTLTPAQILPMIDHALDIKANDAHSVQTFELPAKVFGGKAATIYRAMGHMHLLGTSVKTELVHADGSTRCVLDVEGWEFNWQREYAFKTPITLQAGDALRITCSYDNSAQNQAYLNGVQRTPQDVTWGESSFDEMCMTYMTFTR